MAKLKSGNITFEFRYKEFDEGCWVQYEILFLWENQPMFNDVILKRHNEHWSNRAKNAFKANEHREDSFLPTLEKVLKDNEPDYWEPIEPDVIIGFYPEMLFPFLQSHYQVLCQSPELIEQNKIRERKKKEANGRLPDDYVTLIVFVDQYNLENSEPYSGEGPALIICPKRCQLEDFYNALKEEYQAFKEKYQVDKRNSEDG